MVKKKLLWISDFDVTGYSTASIETINGMILNGCNEFLDIYYFVLNTFRPIDYHKENLSKLIIGFNTANLIVTEIDNNICSLEDTNPIVTQLKVMQVMRFNTLINSIKLLKPDICVILNDNQYVETYGKLIKKSGINTVIVGYLPLDCEHFPSGFFKKMEENLDYIMTLNEFSKKELLDAGVTKKIIVINHPISQDLFKPMDKNDARIKVSLFMNDDRLKNDKAYIIVNSNNSQRRKRIDITVEAFVKLLNKHREDPIYLILKKRSFVFDDIGKPIEEFIKETVKKYEFDFTKNIIFIPQLLSYEELNYLYNSANVCISTNMGEGWGIIPCEAALCNIPQIVPDNTSHPEIFKDIKLIPTNKVSWYEGNFGIKNDYKFMAILFSQGIKDHLNSKLDKVENINEIKIDKFVKILISPRIRINNMIIGELITDDIKFHAGFNDIKYINEFVEKFRPQLFKVYIEICRNEYEFAYNQIQSFEWKKVITESYKIDQCLNTNINKLYFMESMKVCVPKVDEAFAMLEYYYENPEIAKSDGVKCRENILKFNKERIGKEMNEILISFLVEDQTKSCLL